MCCSHRKSAKQIIPNYAAVINFHGLSERCKNLPFKPEDTYIKRLTLKVRLWYHKTRDIIIPEKYFLSICLIYRHVYCTELYDLVLYACVFVVFSQPNGTMQQFSGLKKSFI